MCVEGISIFHLKAPFAPLGSQGMLSDLDLSASSKCIGIDGRDRGKLISTTLLTRLWNVLQFDWKLNLN